MGPLRQRLRAQDPQETAHALREEIRAECANLKAALQRLEESVQQELQASVEQVQELAQQRVLDSMRALEAAMGTYMDDTLGVARHLEGIVESVVQSLGQQDGIFSAACRRSICSCRKL